MEETLFRLRLAQVRPQTLITARMGGLKQFVLAPAEQRRNEKCRKIEIIKRLQRETHTGEQIFDRERQAKLKAVNACDGHPLLMQTRND